MKRVVLWAVIAAVVLGTAYQVLTRYLRSDEERIRRVIAKVISAVETDNPQLSVFSLRGYLAKDYGHRGEMIAVDRQTALRYLGGLKQAGYVDFQVEIRDLDVTIDGETARAEFAVRVTAAKKGSPEKRVELLTRRGLNRGVVDFVKDEGDWLVAGSERVPGDWEDAPPP